MIKYGKNTSKVYQNKEEKEMVGEDQIKKATRYLYQLSPSFVSNVHIFLNLWTWE